MISIIIPLYNKKKYIGITIKSVLQQTCKKWELIIVDDGSTDGSLEIASVYSKEDSRIKIIQREKVSPEVKGANVCRNIGAADAQGDFLIFLDADDLMMSHCVEQRLDYINRFPGEDMYIFNVAYCKGEEAKPFAKFRPKTSDVNKFKRARNKRLFFLKKFLRFDLPWHTSGPVWAKEFFRDIGGFDIRFQRLQDPEVHTRTLMCEKTKINYLMHCSDYDILHRKDEDRVVWGKEEFFNKQINGVVHYVNTFYAKLLESGYSVKFTFLMQGYLLEAEKVLYRYRRESNDWNPALLEEMNRMYEEKGVRAICNIRYTVFKKVYDQLFADFLLKFKVPGIWIRLYKKCLGN